MRGSSLHQPHPRRRDLLLLKDDNVAREFDIVFNIYFPKSVDYDFLINSCGWRGCECFDNLQPDELAHWLKENCTGSTKINTACDFSNKITRIFFELEEDIILYKLRFVANTDS